VEQDIPNKMTRMDAGRKGGKIGGLARVPKGFSALDPEDRKLNAQTAAAARWESVGKRRNKELWLKIEAARMRSRNRPQEVDGEPNQAPKKKQVRNPKPGEKRILNHSRQTVKRCAELSPVDAAYIAGIIDGEGCVGLYVRTRPNKRGWTHSFNVAVHMTDPEPIRFLRDTTKIGTFAKIHPPSAKAANCKMQYTYTCTSDGAASLLEQILPYMRIPIKREKAERLIELQKLYRDGEIIPEDMLSRMKFPCLAKGKYRKTAQMTRKNAKK
jgi:hypothetical protein